MWVRGRTSFFKKKRENGTGKVSRQLANALCPSCGDTLPLTSSNAKTSQSQQRVGAASPGAPALWPPILQNSRVLLLTRDRGARLAVPTATATAS